MMSLYVAPRREQALAGVVGFSGRLIAPDLLKKEIKSRPPILLVHGDADEVVPVESVFHAKEGLSSSGIDVTAVSRPGLGHGIDPDGINHAVTFLNSCFDS